MSPEFRANKLLRRRGAHCGGALRVRVSVVHVGKLFERVNTDVTGAVEVRPRKKAPCPDPNFPFGQRPQHRGGNGRSIIAGRLRLQIIQAKPHARGSGVFRFG